MRQIRAALWGVLAAGLCGGVVSAQEVAHAQPVRDAYRSALWVENVGTNTLYHDEGGGSRRFAFGASATGGNYFLFQANHAGFFGMAVQSPQATAQPYYAYRAGSSGIANHWYTPGNSSWNVGVDNDHALQIDANRDLRVIQGEVHADGYQLNADRYLFVRYVSWDFVQNPYLGGFVARLDLPQGAEIVQFQASVVTTGDTAAAQIIRSPDGWTVPGAIQVLCGVSANTNSTPSTTAVSNGVVDNFGYAYHIVVSQPSGTLVRSVRVQYKVGEL